MCRAQKCRVPGALTIQPRSQVEDRLPLSGRSLTPLKSTWLFAGRFKSAGYPDHPASLGTLIIQPRSQVEEEAKKIAEAVTRVITSPAVSKKIADLAMDAAAAKVSSGNTI